MEKTEQKIEIKRVPMVDYDEFHLTLRSIDIENGELQGVLQELEKEDISIVKIVFFGDISRIEKMMPEIAKKHPCLVIGNSLPDENVSVYIYGIKILRGRSEKVELGGEILGRYFDFPDYAYLSVSGSYLKNRADDFKAEAAGEYGKIAKILARYDFSAKDIYRFWNYMARIWENYPAFNEARNAYFAENGIVKLPAATGIEAALGGGKKISLGFEAIKPKNETGFNWEVFGLEAQREPAEYGTEVSGLPSGPKFSRAARLDFLDKRARKFYVSGISSANEAGESSRVSDLENNVAYVMESFEKLLEKGGFKLTDLVSVHVYSKTRKISQEFEKLYAAKSWRFPYNPVFTNICREDFLFEIEGVAADRKKEEHIIK